MGNPGDLAFGWAKGNDSSRLTGFEVDGSLSLLALDAHEDSFGTYFCHANNSMGAGYPCEIDVQGMHNARRCPNKPSNHFFARYRIAQEHGQREYYHYRGCDRGEHCRPPLRHCSHHTHLPTAEAERKM